VTAAWLVALLIGVPGRSGLPLGLHSSVNGLHDVHETETFFRHIDELPNISTASFSLICPVRAIMASLVTSMFIPFYLVIIWEPSNAF
jgi:hypothetical protein